MDCYHTSAANNDMLYSSDLEEVLLQSRQKHFVVRMRSTFSASVRSITRCASFKVGSVCVRVCVCLQEEEVVI